MTETAARRLAGIVEESRIGTVSVVAEGRFFAVAVRTADAAYTLRDEADWQWLRSKLVDPPSR